MDFMRACMCCDSFVGLFDLLCVAPSLRLHGQRLDYCQLDPDTCFLLWNAYNLTVFQIRYHPPLVLEKVFLF